MPQLAERDAGLDELGSSAGGSSGGFSRDAIGSAAGMDGESFAKKHLGDDTKTSPIDHGGGGTGSGGHSEGGGPKKSEGHNSGSPGGGASGGLKGGATDAGINKAVDAGIKHVPGTKSDEELANEGAAAQAARKAGGKAANVAAQAAADSTGVGVVASKALGDAAQKLVERMDLKKFARNAGISVFVVLSPALLLFFIGAYVATHPWSAVKLVLSNASMKRVAYNFAKQAGNTVVSTALKQFSYEVDYKPGQAIAAPTGSRPAAGTLLDKISRVDFEKSKYQYKDVNCPYDVKTKKVVAFDGKTRSVIDRVVDKNGVEADTTKPEVISCIYAHYPLLEAMMRSPQARKVNQAMNVQLSYAEPSSSGALKGKTDTEVKEVLHKKTLERVWKNDGESTDCNKNYKDATGTTDIEKAIARTKNDLRCGTKPGDIKLPFSMPTDKVFPGPNYDPVAYKAALPKAVETICNFNDYLIQDAQAYQKHQTNRVKSASRAGFQALTLGDTGLNGDISTSELNSDFYKVSNFASSRSYNHIVNGTSTGKQIDPAAAATTVMGLIGVNARGVVSNTTSTGAFSIAGACADLKKAPSDPQKKLTVANTYIILKAAIRDNSNNYFPSLADFDMPDVYVRTVKIVNNISNAGTEDGPDNFNNMMQGAKTAAYNHLLGIGGGHYETDDEANKSSAMVEGINRFNEQHSSLAYRLFSKDNVRSLASRFSSQVTATPGQVGEKALAAAIDIVNPIKTAAHINDAIAYYGFGENNRAIAATDDDIVYYKLKTAGADGNIDMLANAKEIEGIKKNGSQAQKDAFTKWDDCSSKYWASAELLDLDPSAYNPKDPESKKSTTRYCQVIRRTPNNSSIPENFSGEKALAAKYANYIGNSNLFEAWAKLSNDTNDDSIYAGSDPSGGTVSTPSGGSTNPAAACPTDTGISTASAMSYKGEEVVNAKGVAQTYSPGKQPKSLIQLCNVQGIIVSTTVASNLNKMISAAKSDGINLTGGGWRSYAQQVDLRQQHGCTSDSQPANACSPPTAVPGSSNHEQGEAIDFRNSSSRSTPVYVWLSQHAGQYDFRNLPSESWHWSRSGG